MANPFATSAMMPPFPLDFGGSTFGSNNNNNNNNFLYDNSTNPFVVPEKKYPDSKGWQHQPVTPQYPQYPMPLQQQKKKTEDMDIDICVACAECGSRSYTWSDRKEITDPVTKVTLIYCCVSCALHLKKMHPQQNSWQ